MDGIPCKEKHPVVAFLDSMVSSFAIKWWNTFYNFDVDKKKKSQNMRFENKKQQKHQSQSSHWQKSNHFIVALTVI